MVQPLHADYCLIVLTIRRLHMSERNPFHATTSDNLRRRQRADRRKELRHTMTLPVKVVGADCHNRQWSELSETINVSSGGVAIRLAKRVMIGDILFLELPLPARLRKNPDPSGTYKSYALVRYIEMRKIGYQIVRMQFLRNPTRIH